MAARELQFHPLASRDYRGAVRWYAHRSAQAASRFALAVDSALQEIAEDPLRYPKYRGRVRWIRLRRFPYTLFVQIVDDNTIRVAAVAHDKRRPGYWLKRIAAP